MNAVSFRFPDERTGRAAMAQVLEFRGGVHVIGEQDSGWHVDLFLGDDSPIPDALAPYSIDRFTRTQAAPAEPKGGLS